MATDLSGRDKTYIFEVFQENLNTRNQLSLYRSLFKGRDDVFAIRWQKGNKSGYMPSYQYDPYMYQLHKMKGGSFKNYKDKIGQTAYNTGAFCSL